MGSKGSKAKVAKLGACEQLNFEVRSVSVRHDEGGARRDFGKSQRPALLPLRDAEGKAPEVPAAPEFTANAATTTYQTSYHPYSALNFLRRAVINRSRRDIHRRYMWHRRRPERQSQGTSVTYSDSNLRKSRTHLKT